MLRYFHQYQSSVHCNKHPTILDSPTSSERIKDSVHTNIAQALGSLNNNRPYNNDINSFSSTENIYNVSILKYSSIFHEIAQNVFQMLITRY